MTDTIIDPEVKERRRFKRFPIDFTGVLIIQGESYVGHVKNVSEEGVGYLSILDFYIYHNDLLPNKEVSLILEDTLNDNVINLDCEIIWTHMQSTGSSRPFVGLKVLNPPSAYKYLVNNLE